MDKWLLDRLACPQHKQALSLDGDQLFCPRGDKYPMIEGIPVLLFDDGREAHGHIRRSLEQVRRIESGEPIGQVIADPTENKFGVDSFVQQQLPYTCGNLYYSVQKKLTRYPLGAIRLPPGNGQKLLDIGCSWGRWTIPAAKLGYEAVGIDPHLEGTMAAKRISEKMGVKAHFIVADAVSLPFVGDTFDVVFSYSVLQHLAKPNVIKTLAEISRVARAGGQIQIQMPNQYGVRSLYHQAKRITREPKEGGDVFYWTPSELQREFGYQFGNAEISVDCFFGLNLQRSDTDLMPLPHRLAIHASEALRNASSRLQAMRYIADSLYVSSVNNKS